MCPKQSLIGHVVPIWSGVNMKCARLHVAAAGRMGMVMLLLFIL